MSNGYGVNIRIPHHAAAAALSIPVTVLPPLALEPASPVLVMKRGSKPQRPLDTINHVAWLLIAGQGSRLSPASAKAVENVAATLRRQNEFFCVTAAYLEEPPFLRNELASTRIQTVACGFFGDGPSGYDDVKCAIEEAGTPCVYTKPIGADPEISVIMKASVAAALPPAPYNSEPKD